MAQKRDYKQEYNSYHAQPAQVKKRALRNAARAMMEKKHGDIPRSMDVDHKKPLRSGGTNAMSNLRVVSVKKNRGWKEGR
jgi:hypothetical protein